MASVSFPNNPSNGDTITSGGITYTYNATKGVWRDSATAVTSEVGSSVTVYANTDTLPLSGVDNGSLAHVTSTNRLYIWTGTGWYNIALINQTPTIQANSYSSSYTLDNTGANTVIELVASDPEDLPITWTYTTTLTGNTASISQSNNIFTITPSTDSADAGTFSITFKASDGVNIGTATSSFTLAFVSSYWKDVALLTGTNDTNALQNDSFVDRSTNGYTITPAGDPTQSSFHPYLDNYSVYFDGSGDYLLPGITTAIGTNDFTLEGWFYFEDVSSDTTFFDLRTSGNWGIFSFFGSNQTVGYYNGSASVGQTTNTVTANEWNHIAYVRESGSIKIYINGVLGSTTSDTTSWTIASSSRIGANQGNVNYVDGYISDVRLVNGTAVYTSNFTPPTEKLTAIANTVLLTCQSNRFIDNSSSAHTITPAGNVAIKSFNPFGQSSVYAPGENKGSVYFDGTGGSYLKSSTEAVFGFGTDDFTIECWYYPVSKPQLYPRIWHFGSYWLDSNALAFLDRHNDYSSIFSVASYSLGYILQSTTTVTNNVWYHLAVVRNGSTITLYVNGIAEDTYNIGTSEFITSSSSYLNIGNVSNGGNLNESETNAYISDLKYIKGTAVYTSNFTPPTSPVGNTNASLYLPMDNAGIFDQSGNHTLTLVGDAQTSTTQTKYATTSMYFDGSGDYVTISDLGLSGDITLEGWFYQSVAQSATYRCIIGASTYGSSLPLRIYTYNSNFEVWLTGAGGPHISGSFTANTWHHVALVRSSGTWTLYIDGTSAGTSTTSGTYDFASTVDWTIGADAATTYPFTGYIEDVQIIKGQAKYTVNFTPPTASLSSSIQ